MSRDSLVTNRHCLARKLELWSFVTREFCRRQKLRLLELFGQPRSHLHSPQMLSTPQASDQAVLAAGDFPTCRRVRHADISFRTASPTPATASQSPLARFFFSWKTAHVQGNWWTTTLNGTCREPEEKMTRKFSLMEAPGYVFTWTGRSPQWMNLRPVLLKRYG